MPKFVRLGNTWFRPEDIKWFQASASVNKTKLHMIDDIEWYVDERTENVAKLLNEEPK